MDPPPPTTTVLHHLHQDSVESSSVSSPTCRQWDDTLPPPKLRMMCSYGGHIIPRPHDKSLCYVGGETRIVVADRHTSLSDLCSRLSTTLLHGRRFSLKYQLPTEDLDSLVSITTDEDLDNMVEEYDRLNSTNPSAKPSRIRLFLFLTKPETAASMGSLLDDAKSETWFVDALNGAGLLPRGFSDSAPIDNLLESKDEENIQVPESDLQRRRLDVQFYSPDSQLVETTTSSFGSSSSSPTMSNLPPIKVKVDHMINQMAGLDEQLSQLNVVAPVNNGGGWDDERSDHGGLTGGGGGMRKPPLPLQPVQRKFGHDAYSLPSPDSKHGGAYGLHSPDSIASDNSIVSASKPTFTQDPSFTLIRDTPTPPSNTQFFPNTMNHQIPVQETANSTDTPPPPPAPSQPNHDQPPPPPQQQQQFYQTRPHYINHPQQPISSYYPIYTQPPQIDHHQYPFYFLPVSHNHHYGMQMPSNSSPTEPPTTTTTTTPPLYPTKTGVQSSKPDMVTNSLGMIQVPSNQFQQQYMNISQIPIHPNTQMATSNGGNYGYEYAHPTQEQIYYPQHHSVAAPLASQYQTMTPASAMMLTQMPAAQQPAAQESGKQ